MFVNETFLTPYMTVNWHREFAVNFATFLKVCRDFFSLLHRDFRLALRIMLILAMTSCARPNNSIVPTGWSC